MLHSIKRFIRNSGRRQFNNVFICTKPTFAFSFIILAVCTQFCVGTAFGQESMMPAIAPGYVSKLVAYAKANYPRIKRSETAVEKQEDAVKRAKLSWFEALTFTYSFNPNNRQTANPVNYAQTYQTGIFLNIGTLLEKSPEIKIAKKERDMAEFELAEANLNIEATVKERYYTYVEKVNVLKIRTKYVEDAASSFTLVKHKFEKGEETFDNYNKALLLNSVAVQNKIECEGAMLRAKASLEELLGKNLEDIK